MRQTILILFLCLISYFSAMAQTNVLPASGNVGIGIMQPKAMLHVNNGNDSYGTILANGSEAPFALYAKTLRTSPVFVESFRLGMKYNTDERNGFISFFRGGSFDGGWLSFGTNGIERVIIDAGGNVGVGTKKITDRLSVNGNIRAKEIRVEAANWPDYVFKEDYRLPTLEEVKQHIKDKGHLPNMPTAKEVEENGVSLGEMNKKLLEKIEELTLYLLEIKEENKELKKGINSLKQK